MVELLPAKALESPEGQCADGERRPTSTAGMDERIVAFTMQAGHIAESGPTTQQGLADERYACSPLSRIAGYRVDGSSESEP